MTGRVTLRQDRTIIVAPNGARPTQLDHPCLPITIEELVSQLSLCAESGAAMAHVHCRDKEGIHTLDIGLNRELLCELRHQLDDQLVIQLTTEAVGVFTPQQQTTLIQELSPEAASFSIRELIPDAAHIPAASRFFLGLREKGIYVQFILYDAADLSLYFQLVNQGKLPSDGHHLLLVLGRHKKTCCLNRLICFPCSNRHCWKAVLSGRYVPLVPESTCVYLPRWQWVRMSGQDSRIT